MYEGQKIRINEKDYKKKPMERLIQKLRNQPSDIISIIIKYLPYRYKVLFLMDKKMKYEAADQILEDVYVCNVTDDSNPDSDSDWEPNENDFVFETGEDGRVSLVPFEPVSNRGVHIDVGGRQIFMPFDNSDDEDDINDEEKCCSDLNQDSKHPGTHFKVFADHLIKYEPLRQRLRSRGLRGNVYEKTMDFNSLDDLFQVIYKYKKLPKNLYLTSFTKSDESHFLMMRKIPNITIDWKNKKDADLELLPLLDTPSITFITKNLKFSQLNLVRNVTKLCLFDVDPDEPISSVNTKTTHLKLFKDATTVNQSLCHFKNLTYLDLFANCKKIMTNNKVKDLDEQWCSSITTTSLFNFPSALTELRLQFPNLSSYDSLKKLTNLKVLRIRDSVFPITLFNGGTEYFPDLKYFEYAIFHGKLRSMPALENNKYRLKLDHSVKFPSGLKELDLDCAVLEITPTFDLPQQIEHFNLDISLDCFDIVTKLYEKFED